jgi:hypothetical protein
MGKEKGGVTMPTDKPAGSGRKAGTPNKKTRDLMDRCQMAGIDPFQVLLDLAKASPDEAMRFSAAKELCHYLYPKRKAIERSSEDSEIRLTIRDYTRTNSK